MKSLTLTRGVALSVALSFVMAPPAFAHRRAPLVSNQQLAAQTGENTKLNLGGGSGTTAHAASTGTGGSIIRTLVALLVVIAVIYGIAWVLKQFRAGRSRASGKGLEQVATLPLSGGRSVSLVRVGNELILLGVAENSVTALRRYSEAEALDAGLRLDAIDADAEFIEIEPATATPPRAVPQLAAGKMLESLRALTVRH